MKDIKYTLMLESVSLFLLSILAYALWGSSWLLFLALFFVPELGMLGYLKNATLGQKTYNLFHNLFFPTLLILFGLVGSFPLFISLGIIWSSHIHFDRLLGFGLKHQEHFKSTHLGLILSSQKQHADD